MGPALSSRHPDAPACRSRCPWRRESHVPALSCACVVVGLSSGDWGLGHDHATALPALRALARTRAWRPARGLEE
eukprot:369801-Pyramimonas_sp.AAC.1